ncbi:MAG: TraR/DksA family transcriptional regulator [bacterium]
MKHSSKFLDVMKGELVKRQGEITAILSRSNQDNGSGDTVQDSGDEALSLSMDKLKSSLEQSEIDELRNIEGALKRIEKGEFGYCIDCEAPISEKRLQNSPYAARCIVCQEEFEG